MKGARAPEGPPAAARTSPRPAWEFGYAPVGSAAYAAGGDAELVVATSEPVAADDIARAAAIEGAVASRLVARAPVFWTRLTLPSARELGDVDARLRAAGIPLRYVASARRGSFALGPPLGRGPVARPEAWPLRAAPEGGAGDPESEADAAGLWFLRDGEGGVAVDRARFGGGAGMRLAVIDDDAAEAEALELSAEVLLGVDAPPRHHVHGSLMVAWATRARGFAGVAPDASARLYVIPKPGGDVTSLPAAIVRAVSDGADVVVCATYVEGTTSPMLDDALDFARRLGRRGRGAPVVMPTGRETSSAGGSVHASFSLGLGEPASDPRVLCAAPGARGEGWFFWRDRRGRSRPFANRGPAVRWLAPGDDIAYPFAASSGTAARLFHAESSGAAAIAAGVLLLVLAANRGLRVDELDAIVASTATPIAPETPERHLPVADPSDALPLGRDRDGHNAKHGYGRIDAGRACLAAADPVAAALVGIGEDGAARAWLDLRRTDPSVRAAYSRRLGRWLVRALLASSSATHAARVVARHLRLISGREDRLRAHGSGAIVRQIALLIRACASSRPRPPPRVAAELAEVAARLGAIAFDPVAGERLDMEVYRAMCEALRSGGE